MLCQQNQSCGVALYNVHPAAQRSIFFTSNFMWRRISQTIHLKHLKSRVPKRCWDLQSLWSGRRGFSEGTRARRCCDAVGDVRRRIRRAGSRRFDLNPRLAPYARTLSSRATTCDALANLTEFCSNRTGVSGRSEFNLKSIKLRRTCGYSVNAAF